MQFFRDTNINFLGWKWYFLGFSLIFSVAGVLSMLFWHGVPLGVEFRGGTLLYVKFANRPNEDQIRAELDKAGIHNARIQSIQGVGAAGSNEELIDVAQNQAAGADVTQVEDQIVRALEVGSGNPPDFTRDLNYVGVDAVRASLVVHDPLHAAPDEYDRIAKQILNYRDNQHGGLINNFDDLHSAGVPQAAVDVLKQDFFISNFHKAGSEIVGPQVGSQLRKQAVLATLYSMAGMLLYLWFRFEMIYGVAAVVACFHDTLITVGAFSLTNTDITLTVIAAILTLVGYSMNDTIVVFDRIRENVKLMRRESLAEVVNRSINQTLSRTILTSGLTFLTVLSLYLFGGEVLHGFSMALVIGILIGTYSSIAVAAPMLVAYQDWRAGRSRRTVPVSAPAGKGKVRAKA